MRELDFINNQSPAPDAAITAYVDMYDGELPEQAIKALRAATRLSNKKLAKALAAIVQETEAVEMEVL
jgi:DNA-binding transcriptional regulator YiaG